MYHAAINICTNLDSDLNLTKYGIKMTKLTQKELMIISYGLCEISSIFRGINRQIHNEEMKEIFNHVMLDYVDLSALIAYRGDEPPQEDDISHMMSFFKDRHSSSALDEEG